MLTLTSLTGSAVYPIAAHIQAILESPAGTSIRVQGMWIEVLEDHVEVADQYVRAMGLEYEEGDDDGTA